MTSTRIITVLATLALAGSAGCARSSRSRDTLSQQGLTDTDVQGLAKETLLVMKFHHDN